MDVGIHLKIIRDELAKLAEDGHISHMDEFVAHFDLGTDVAELSLIIARNKELDNGIRE